MKKIILIFPILFTCSSFYTQFGNPQQITPTNQTYLPLFSENVYFVNSTKIDSLCKLATKTVDFTSGIFNVDNKYSFLIYKRNLGGKDTILPFLFLVKQKPALPITYDNAKEWGIFYATKWIIKNPNKALSINWKTVDILYEKKSENFIIWYGINDYPCGLRLQISKKGKLTSSKNYSGDSGL